MPVKIRASRTKQASTEDDDRTLGQMVTRGNPWLLAGLAGILGGGTGYLGAEALEGLLDETTRRYSHLMPGEHEIEDEYDIMNPVEEAERARNFRRRMALAGGLSAAALPTYYAIQDMRKTSSEKQAHMISYDSSLSTIQDDQFLNSNQKNQVTSILGNANSRAPQSRKLHGMLSTSDLVRGAVGAGLGREAASMTGSVLGSIFDLPQGMQKRLSDVGALAGGLIGTKIVN